MLTVDQLNELSSADNCLLFLRVLNTSDLTFMYMLFKGTTIVDIIEVCADLLKLDDEYVKTAWPAIQIAEYNTYLDTLREYVENYTTPHNG